MSRAPLVTVADVTVPAVAGATQGLRGVLAVPRGEGPWPGVVMVHEAFGIDDVMRRQVERMASAGYLVLMPDLFTRGRLRCLVSTFRAMASGRGRAWADIESARRHLAERDDCTGWIGVLGFCMGGGFALVAATRGFDASSVNYGQLPRDLDSVAREACPVVASYGARDPGSRGAAATLEVALSRHGIDHDVVEYPDAGHSFLNDAEVGPRPLRPLMRIAGVGPEPASAADAWRRIEAFFAEHLSGRP